MGERAFYFVLLFCWHAFPPPALPQNIAVLPKLEPSYVNHFYQEEDSYSKKCFSNAFLGRQGHLWLTPCGVERLINSLGLFQFDGYRFQPVEIFTTEGMVIESPVISGMNESGQLWGITGKKQLFLLRPETGRGSIISPPAPSFAGLQIGAVSIEGRTTYVLGRTEDKQIALFRVQEGALVLDQSFGLTAKKPGVEGYTMVMNEREIWFTDGSFSVYGFDRKKKALREYIPQDDAGRSLEPPPGQFYSNGQSPNLLESPDGNIYLLQPGPNDNLLFRFDREKGRFLAMKEAFPSGWRPVGIFQDGAKNICFLFRDKAGAFRSILKTADGRQFDYSAVVAPQKGIVGLAGRDFRRQAFLLTNNGLYCAGIRERGLIRRALEGKWISSMASLPDGRLLVNTIGQGWFVFDETAGEYVPFQGPGCGIAPPAFHKGMKQQVIPDEEGNLWFISHNYLVRYHPATGSCQAFDLKINSNLFEFVRDELVVFQHGRFRISFFDLRTQKVVSPPPGIPDSLGGFIRDLLVDAEGILWVPTNNGLWRMDIAAGKSEVLGLEDGFADFRFTAIYEDARGRLWLGTYFGGMHIYQPKTGEVAIIDQGRGLSDNAIMGIIADEDGDMWVSTVYGLNIVSAEGTVLYSIYEEDGLAHEIFERFDPYRGRNGRLYFGSREGISIIAPRALKDYMKSGATVQIYLTELSYYDKTKEEEVALRSRLQKPGPIQISPERPYLRLRFGLSSYLEPHKNRYAYILEGKDEDWHYLGAQPELNISRLPPGKYRLLAKGADFRNNWTEEPVVIDIHAREFFYNQTWFYLLAALPFVAFALIWARNKQLEARRLEKEVAQRTRKIREDKALIEKQARELQQLDEMKSRFFTNISHELRTPITLIRAPLENLIGKHGDSLDERIRRSLKLVLNNAGKLSGLVEELLELSSLEAKKTSLKETPTPLAPFCRRLFSAYEPGAALKDIDYRFHSTLEESANFLLDRNRLEKIINNLLSNALKFTPEKGSVRMGLRREGTALLITVEDNGRGIPPEDLPHLFERYFQTRRDDIATEGGTGIGLALSRELAQLMQGQLSVESQWGAGACFTLRLPAREAPPEAKPAPLPEITETAAREVQPVIPAAGNGPKTKIMVVEDNPDMQELIHTLLADSYDCVLANNGAEAWSWLEMENPEIADIELILSDVMMPEMNGYTLLERVKAHERWQKLPAVMLTARSAEEDKLQALRMGVDDYLLKPFSPEELKARLNNLISNYRARRALLASMSPPPGKGASFDFEPATPANTAWLKEVEEAAKEALDKGLKLNTALLAEKAFLGERQFARRLKALTGLTPNGYILEVKLQKARYLLETQAFTTVSEVAHASGFSSGSYLAKVFQEHFGKKPGDYF